jgi:hypothetical protein
MKKQKRYRVVKIIEEIAEVTASSKEEAFHNYCNPHTVTVKKEKATVVK